MVRARVRMPVTRVTEHDPSGCRSHRHASVLGGQLRAETGPFQLDLGAVCTQSSSILLGMLYLYGHLFAGTCPISSSSASPYINLTTW